jgi:hypothetical protein
MSSTVFSFGGGTQTAAIAVLILQGKLPRPDVVVMADTGREIESTWVYLDEIIAPALASIGLTVQIASHELAKVDIYAHNGDLLLPAYTSQKDGGKLPTFCSDKWKKHVIRRWLRANDYNDVDVWLGISTDEIERMKPSGLNWYRHVYPLIEMIPTTRAQCSALVESFGWPKPPKSRCWMCPNQSPQMWAEMRRTQPQEFAKATDLEKQLQAHDEHIYLHRAMIPLVDAVNLTDQQPGLFDGCDSGYCFV